MTTDGWIGFPQLLVGAHEPGRRHPRGPAGVGRLVDAFPGTERRMVLELLDDPRQQPILGGEPAGRQVGNVAESQPTMEAVRCRGVQDLALCRDLLLDRLRAPDRSSGADEARAPGRELGQSVRSIRRLRAQGRPIREDERRSRSPLHNQRACGAIDSRQRSSVASAHWDLSDTNVGITAARRSPS